VIVRAGGRRPVASGHQLVTHGKGLAMSDMFAGGLTSTWDDWLVSRSGTGDQYADGMARALQDPNFGMAQLDLSAQGTRDGLRQLFEEFETATAGQEVTGRGAVFHRRGPDVWRVAADRSQDAVTLDFGTQEQPGMFIVMERATAASFAAAVKDAIAELES
jgi:hypothetical protein